MMNYEWGRKLDHGSTRIGCADTEENRPFSVSPEAIRVGAASVVKKNYFLFLFPFAIV
jgi:hypothetical protein